jgi:hypothetical protein
MLDFNQIIRRFFDAIANGEIEIYNEFSLQHELGIYLRSLAKSGFRVQFERPVSFFGYERKHFEKREIDIAIFSPDLAVKYAIELKYPRNGQHPEQMFKACQDICFIEQLYTAGFTNCYFIMVADDPLFYIRGANEGIYQYFRGSKLINGIIQKPTGMRDHTIQIEGQYSILWNEVTNITRYALVSMKG